ncbi:MAG: SEC-C metal-binding domain-containing protein, partial [Patescibacteria group bacterium]
MPIENGMISKSIESAQKKVEGNNFDIRKHLVEYDDIINKHREVIYKKRKEILDLDNLGKEKNTKDIIMGYITEELTALVNFHIASPNPDDWNLTEVAETMNSIVPLSDSEKSSILNQKNSDKILPDLLEIISAKYQVLENSINALEQFKGQDQPLRKIEKSLLLQAIDTLWVEHLEAIDHLRTGIGLRGYGQHDPLVEYKKESYILFKTLLDEIQNQVVFTIFKLGQSAAIAVNSPMAKQNLQFQAPAKIAGPVQASANLSNDKVGRNDPCPCGSGLKYKKCHGK